MQRDVYTNDEMATLFNTNFINYRVDADSSEGPDLKLIYDIHVIPTLLFLDAKGKVILRKEGAAYPTELKKIALEALSLRN